MPKLKPDPIVAAVDEALGAGRVVFRGDQFDLDKGDCRALGEVKKLFSPLSPEDLEFGVEQRGKGTSQWAGEFPLSPEKARVLVGALVRARRDRDRHYARLTAVKQTINVAETTRAALVKLFSYFDNDAGDREAFNRVRKVLASVIDDGRNLRRQLPRQVDANTARAGAGTYIALVVRSLTGAAHTDLVLDLIEAALDKRMSERALTRGLIGMKNKIGPLT